MPSRCTCRGCARRSKPEVSTSAPCAASATCGKATMPDSPAGPSIRRQLLVFLISCLVFMVGGAATVTYFVALKSANDAYDRSLLDPAFDLAQNIRLDAGTAHLDLPQKALQALVFDQVDRVVFQIRAPDDTVIEGNTDLPTPPTTEPGEHHYYDAMYVGEPMRLAALRTKSGYLVQVGETLHKRNRLIGEIVVAELAPTLIVARSEERRVGKEWR